MMNAKHSAPRGGCPEYLRYGKRVATNDVTVNSGNKPQERQDQRYLTRSVMYMAASSTTFRIGNIGQAPHQLGPYGILKLAMMSAAD
jgi:hypothetical protein